MTATNTLLRGAYDLHVHCSPDVVPRAEDAYDLAAAAYAAGMAGVGLKDHTTSTVGRCHTLNRMYPKGPKFFSSIALNPPVGGLNPAAVESALLSGVDIVYMPTYSAAHHIDVLGEKVTPVPHPSGGVQRLSLLDSSGKLSSPAEQIIEAIARHDAVLATGHVSPGEILAVMQYAKSCGVQRTIVTHASQRVPGISIEEQRRAVGLGALIEHSFLAVTPCCPGDVSLEEIADQIRQVGCQHVVLSSDFGQPANGAPVEAFGRHADQLRQLGFRDPELRQMLCQNPARLVGGRRAAKPNR